MAIQQCVREDFRVTVDTGALGHNVGQLRSRCSGGVKFCAVVKANAYGHGILNVVEAIKGEVDYFAVASIYEALAIAGKTGGRPILVLEPIHPGIEADLLRQSAEKGIQCTVSSVDSLKYIGDALGRSAHQLRVHMNLDTGMGRCGAAYERGAALLEAMGRSRHLKPVGLYTHFATADEQDLSFAREQLGRFEAFVTQLPKGQRRELIVHAANSPATIQLEGSHFDMVRCGISVYGYTTIESEIPICLKPALKLEAPIVHVLLLDKGQSASYGRTFIAQRPTRAAVLSMGYADGFWRRFSNQACVRIGDQFANIIGRVTMNQIIVDVTDIADVQPGQWATLIDNDYHSSCGVYALAKRGETICYEILTSVPSHAHYQFVKSFA